MAAEDLRGFFYQFNKGSKEEEDEEYIHPLPPLPSPCHLQKPRCHHHHQRWPRRHHQCCPHHYQQCCSGQHHQQCFPLACMAAATLARLARTSMVKAGEEDVPAPAGEVGAGEDKYLLLLLLKLLVIALRDRDRPNSKHSS